MLVPKTGSDKESTTNPARMLIVKLTTNTLIWGTAFATIPKAQLIRKIINAMGADKRAAIQKIWLPECEVAYATDKYLRRDALCGYWLSGNRILSIFKLEIAADLIPQLVGERG